MASSWGRDSLWDRPPGAREGRGLFRPARQPILVQHSPHLSQETGACEASRARARRVLIALCFTSPRRATASPGFAAGPMLPEAYLPKSPIPSSLSVEFEREMGRKSAAHDLDDEDDWQAQSSIMFPTPPTTSSFPLAPDSRHHSRTFSSSSAPAVNRYARSAANDGGGISEADEPAGYGADSGAETRSIHMGGSRPPSTLRQSTRRPYKRSSVAFSVASEADTVATGLGYLFLNDIGDDSATTPTDEMPQDPDAVPAVRSVQRTTADERSTRPVRSMYVAVENELEPPVPAIPASIVDGMYGGTAVRYKGESQHFNSEQAWYYLRELVGEELRLEEGVLWKLSSLAGDEEDMFAGAKCVI